LHPPCLTSHCWMGRGIYFFGYICFNKYLVISLYLIFYSWYVETAYGSNLSDSWRAQQGYFYLRGWGQRDSRRMPYCYGERPPLHLTEHQLELGRRSTSWWLPFLLRVPAAFYVAVWCAYSNILVYLVYWVIRDWGVVVVCYSYVQVRPARNKINRLTGCDQHTQWLVCLVKVVFCHLTSTDRSWGFSPGCLPFFPSLPRQGFCFGMPIARGGVFLASKARLTLKQTDTFLLLRTRREVWSVSKHHTGTIIW